MQRRSATVTVGLVAALSIAMTGCGSSNDDPDYRGVCVDKRTQKRIDDDECKDGHGGGHSSVIFFPRGSTLPPVGSAVSGGTTSVPKGATSVRGGAPKGGGTVRGGFGSSGGKGGSVGG